MPDLPRRHGDRGVHHAGVGDRSDPTDPCTPDHQSGHVACPMVRTPPRPAPSRGRAVLSPITFAGPKKRLSNRLSTGRYCLSFVPRERFARVMTTSRSHTAGQAPYTCRRHGGRHRRRRNTVTSQTTPVGDHSAPTMERVAPAIDRISPARGRMTSVIDRAASGIHEASLLMDRAAQAVGRTTCAIGRTALVVDRTARSSHRATPVIDRAAQPMSRTASAIGRTELVVDRTARSSHRATPVIDRAAQPIGRTASAIGRTALGVDRTAPASHRSTRLVSRQTVAVDPATSVTPSKNPAPLRCAAPRSPPKSSHMARRSAMSAYRFLLLSIP